MTNAFVLRTSVVALVLAGAAWAVDAGVPRSSAPALAPRVLEGASDVSCWTLVRQDGGWFWKGLPVRRRDGGAEVPLNRYLPKVPAVLENRERAVLQVNADRTCTVVEAGCECGECRPLARVSCPFTSR